MLYCTKCQTVCADSTRTCPNCKRSRALRPIKDSDEVFFMKVSEAEAAELEEIFDVQAIHCRIDPVQAGYSVSTFDPEFMPTDKNVFVEYGDLERANELMAKEIEDPAEPEEDTMPKGKRLFLETVSIIAFLVLVMLAVFSADAVANWLKALF